MLATTPAIVLATVRYSDTSKVVKLATRHLGLQSAIAKGALRPRSRFGAALQLLSEGVAHLSLRDTRDLQTLTAFEAVRLHDGLARDIGRYAAATALAELLLRLAPPEPHPAIYDLLSASLDALAHEAQDGEALGLRLLWLMVSALGFAPSVSVCVRDGAVLPDAGDLVFSTREGGALCAPCAAASPAARLPAEARRDLLALLDAQAPLPRLDAAHAAAHRRLFSRFLRYHVAEGATLPALEFWARRPGLSA